MERLLDKIKGTIYGQAIGDIFFGNGFRGFKLLIYSMFAYLNFILILLRISANLFH